MSSWIEIELLKLLMRVNIPNNKEFKYRKDVIFINRDDKIGEERDYGFNNLIIICENKNMYNKT